MYAEIDGWEPKGLDRPTNLNNPLDSWLINRALQAVEESTEALDAYELSKATRPVYKLVDDISNWYVRRSRRRFWKSEDDNDKLQAYASLHWALVVACQLLAPWSPFISDWLYRHLTVGITGAPESVHLTGWPKLEAYSDDELARMGQVREFVNEGLAQRAEAKIKVRQPLAKAMIQGKQDLGTELLEIIAEELNVKKVEFKLADNSKVELDTVLSESLSNEGMARDIIRNVQSARKEAGLAVENRISLALYSQDSQLNSAINEFAKLITHETLAEELSTEQKGYSFRKQVTLDGREFIIELDKK
jgi:isoleucyl-tRNA synthetase